MTAARCNVQEKTELRPGVDRESLPPLAEFRANMYRFFSAVFNAPLDRDLLESLFQEDMMDLAEGFASHHSMELLREAAGQNNDLDELRYEYNNLFIVPQARYVTPYESVYRGTRIEKGKEVLGYLNGPETMEVKRAYRNLGLEMDRKKIGPPDFIGTEIEFMHQVAGMEQEAWARHDAKKALLFLKIQKEFFERHLNQWVPALCKRVMERTRSPIYQGLAAVMRDFVVIEAQTFAEILE